MKVYLVTIEGESSWEYEDSYKELLDAEDVEFESVIEYDAELVTDLLLTETQDASYELWLEETSSIGTTYKLSNPRTIKLVL